MRKGWSSSLFHKHIKKHNATIFILHFGQKLKFLVKLQKIPQAICILVFFINNICLIEFKLFQLIS